MTERDFQKAQYNKGGMVETVKELRQEYHVERIFFYIGQIFLDAPDHE